MRLLIEISEDQIAELELICKSQNRSLADIVGQAIQTYLEPHKSGSNAAFGIWDKEQIEGLLYQQNRRLEWQ